MESSLTNIALSVFVVKKDGCYSNWREALVDAKELAMRMRMPVAVVCAHQYQWLINEDTDLEPLFKQRVMIGL